MKELKPCFTDFQHEQNSKSDVYNKKAKIGWKKANESQVRSLVTFLKEKIALFSVVRCACSATTLRGYVFFLMVVSRSELPIMQLDHFTVQKGMFGAQCKKKC